MNTYCMPFPPAKLHNLLTPIGRLPTEILEVIFCIFIASSKSYAPVIDIDAVFLLSHVCARWHAICDNIPLLWTQPYLHRSKSPSLNREIVSSILSRSRNLPVFVTIDMIDIPGCAQEAFLDYQPLLEVQDRLEYLVLAVQRQDVVRHTGEIPKFPILNALNITLGEEAPSELEALCEFFLGSCPSLRKFSLTVHNAVFPARISCVPFHQLTSLTLLVPVQDIDLYDMLIQCSLLEECCLGEVEETGEVHELPIHIMPALRWLDYTVAEVCFGDVLRRLRFPLLQSLALASTQPGCVIPWSPVPIILELHEGDGAMVQLKSLTLTELDINTEELGQLFCCVAPTLERLVLVDMPHTFPLFATAAAPAEVTLPRLATLEIRGHSDKIEGVAVLKMVDSLWARRGKAPFPALRLIQLELDGASFDDAVEERLERVEEQSNGFFKDLGARVEEEEEEEMSDSRDDNCTEA